MIARAMNNIVSDLLLWITQSSLAFEMEVREDCCPLLVFRLLLHLITDQELLCSTDLLTAHACRNGRQRKANVLGTFH